MKTIFQFRDGSQINGDAQEIGKRLDALRARPDGLTPASVVRDARNIRSVLHQYFEWDDTAAAHKFRVDQASRLIRSVQVVYVDSGPTPIRCVSAFTRDPQMHPVRAFVSITRPDGSRKYESTAVAMNEPALRRQVLERAHAELAAFAKKYRDLQELADVFAALDRVGDMLQVDIGQAA